MVLTVKKIFPTCLLYLKPLFIYMGVYFFLPSIAKIIIKHTGLSLFDDWVSWVIVILVCFLFPIIMLLLNYPHLFTAKKFMIRSLILSVFFGFFTIYFFYLAFNHINFSTSTNQKIINSTLSNPSNFAIQLQILKSVILAPILEELVFRGIMMKIYFNNSKFGLDILISSILFGFAHAFNNPLETVPYIIFGIGLAFTYRICGKQLQYPILIHIINNSISSWELLTIYFF